MADTDLFAADGFELTPVAPVAPQPARMLAHTARTAGFIKRGQHLDPGDWNASCRRDGPDRLLDPCVVREVLRGVRSQTGVQVEVRTVGGAIRAIDAAWFRPISWGASRG